MKKNKIYANKILEKIGNNQTSYVIDDEEKEEVKIIDSDSSIKEKIIKLFNTNGYIFNTKVKIITNDKTYDTRIASWVGNSLITLDNDIINIDDIKNIVF